MKYILAILLIVNQAFGSITVGKRFIASPIGNSSIKRVYLRQPVVAGKKPNAIASRKDVLSNHIATCQAWSAMRSIRAQQNTNYPNGGFRPN